MLFGLLDIFSCGMAIDLGTSFTRVFVRRRGIVINQPTVVATSRVGGKSRRLDIGFGAAEMMGRTPRDIDVVRPLKGGVIADFEVAQELVKTVIRAASKRWRLLSPSIVVCVPYGSTAVERRALKEAAGSAGVRTVFMLEAPISAAVGAGVAINESRGSMVIDIGGGTTEIGIICLGEIVHCQSIRVGGDTLTEAIRGHFRRQHNINVGETQAERLKRELGSAVPPAGGPVLSTEVTGTDIASGLPKRFQVDEAEIYRALSETMVPIAIAIRAALENVSPEIAEDIANRGIIVTGGGALLRRMDAFIRECANVAVTIPEDPMLSVVTGAGRSMQHPRVLSMAAA